MKDSLNGISLKDFFEEAEKRLGAFSADQLRAILLEMARHVEPRARGQQSRGDQLIKSLLERHNRKPAFKKAIQACRLEISRS